VGQHDGAIRRTALTTLANRGVAADALIPHYVEFLSEGAQCTDLSQRRYLDSLARVAAALGKAGDTNALAALAELARSVIRRIRRAAVEGLMAFPAAMRADTLFDLTDTHDPDVLKNVAFGLSECNDPRATVPLIRAFMECRGRVRKRANDLLAHQPNLEDVDFLIRCLKEPFASVRQWGANRLQDIHSKRSIDPLMEASHDDDVEVQLAVFEALGPFGSDHEHVRERLLEAIGYGDVSVRQAACEALGNARCVEAVPDLIRALHNFFLRPRATDALRRIGARKGYLAIRRLERREKLFSKKPKDAQTR
jgi:HEAT repeat protein